MVSGAIPLRRPVLCVHGHFYQPPREDPRTGAIPREPGAEPYPNFNAKITAECYRPNAELDNFARLSYDIGPTLASWLAAEAPEVHDAIVAQDSGGAMAQAFNHTILPLATRRDKATQVRWGVADFVHRFGRQPRGLWLPETAADLETLDVLAQERIEFTILAPWQAAGGVADPRHPYRVRLPGGRSIVVFFFDGRLSGEVSFNPRATADAARFARDWLPPAAANTTADPPPLVLIASDGELYGHHQPGRERFLHDLLYAEADRAGYDVILPIEYLDRYPVVHETMIAEPTSWSCHHGVARWITGCACTDTDSAWKATVRQALTSLTEALDGAYERAAAELLRDPWAARDSYIHVMLGEQSLADFIALNARRPLSDRDQRQVALLLEGQMYGQRMHTSCGLYWDDLDRLEMRNDLAYAAKVIASTEAASGASLAGAFRERLRLAHSERTGRDGEQIYREVAGDPRVGARL